MNKRIALATLALISLTPGISFAADEHSMPMPKPTPKHAWLQKLVGKWESTTEAITEPGKPPVKSKGTENIKPLGEFWTISEIQGHMMDKPFTGNMTLGYDTKKQKYIGTWIDSMTGHLWEYEGKVDASGKKLTLESEGECPMNPGKVTKFKEELELKDTNNKVFTSSVQDKDGKWVTMMTSSAQRVDED